MKFLYNLDGGLWLVNGVLWIAYAHVATMGVLSMAAAGLCFWMARGAEA
jgi:hypothetical protein